MEYVYCCRSRHWKLQRYKRCGGSGQCSHIGVTAGRDSIVALELAGAGRVRSRTPSSRQCPSSHSSVLSRTPSTCCSRVSSASSGCSSGVEAAASTETRCARSSTCATCFRRASRSNSVSSSTCREPQPPVATDCRALRASAILTGVDR